MAEALLITRDDLVKLSPLKGGIDPDKYTPFIKMAQDTHLQAILGTKLLVGLKTTIENGGEFRSPYDELMEYIKPCLVHYSMVEFLPWLAYNASNGGVFKHNVENATAVEKAELDYLVEKERDSAEHYGRRLLAYLSENSASIPEYTKNQDGQMPPSSDELFNGWVL